MKVLLVGPELEENLGLRYLASALQGAGHEVEVLPFNGPKDLPGLVRIILLEAPALVGLALVAQRRFGDVSQLITRLRQGGFQGHLTAGGHFASLRAPEILGDLPGLDTILHHDAEARIVALADWIGSGQEAPPAELDGLSWRDATGAIQHRAALTVSRLEALQPPLRRRPDRWLGFATSPLISSRGCAGSCAFCSIHAWHGQVASERLRFREPRAVAEEMIALHRAQGTRVFVFHDDDFIHPQPAKARQRCAEILEAARAGIGAPFAFTLKCRPDNVDEDLFRYLKSMGLAFAFTGIDAHASSAIQALNRRVSPEANQRALAILRKLEIPTSFNLLLYHPDTTPCELAENLAFLEQHSDTPFDVGRVELYARAALEERMLREGRTTGDYRNHEYTLRDAMAERSFQLFATSLGRRHHGEASLPNLMRGLQMQLGVLERLRPSAVSDLRTRFQGLVREVNADTVRFLRTLMVLAERMQSGDACRSELRALAREARVRCTRQTLTRNALHVEAQLRARLSARTSTLEGLRAPWLRTLGRVAAGIPGTAILLGYCACDPLPDGNPPPQELKTFANTIAPILNQHCVECHGATEPGAGLVLTADQAYNNLVGVTSTQAKDLRLVEPGLPDKSYLVFKLAGRQGEVGGSGEQMPKTQLSDAELTTIQDWIVKGAKND